MVYFHSTYKIVHNLWPVSFSSLITSQIVSWRSFGTCQGLVLLFCLMLVHWRMLLGTQVVIMGVLEVLYYGTTDSTQPQRLTTMVPLLVPGLALSVMRAVDMH